jgi:hypothetical protein
MSALEKSGMGEIAGVEPGVAGASKLNKVTVFVSAASMAATTEDGRRATVGPDRAAITGALTVLTVRSEITESCVVDEETVEVLVDVNAGTITGHWREIEGGIGNDNTLCNGGLRVLVNGGVG